MNSVYIPRISSFVTEQMIKDEFANTIGQVRRVDFNTIGKRPGFMEPLKQNQHLFRCAFVHFDLVYNHYFDQFNKYHVDIESLFQLIHEGKSFKYIPSCVREFWLLLQNVNPIPETMMNVHQIVENSRILEERVENLEMDLDTTLSELSELKHTFEEQENMWNNRFRDQQETIDIQDSKIIRLEYKLESIQQVVEQLISGLFNQKTQRNIQQLHMNLLYGEKDDICVSGDTSMWTHYPTTRQSDDHEERILALEKYIHCDFRDIMTISSNSDSDSNSDEEEHEQQSVNSIDTIVSSRRIMASLDLCGNQ